MLILTRRVGEDIRIGSDIEIKILEIRGKHVRIGIDAPDDVDVHREEIYQRILHSEPSRKKSEDGDEQ